MNPRLAAPLRVALRALLAAPLPLAHLRFGDPPRNDRGVPLDWHLHLLVTAESRVFGGIAKGLPKDARASMRLNTAIVASRPRHVLTVTDDRVPGGPAVRIYRPPGGPFPAFVFLHGGGWVQGDLDTHDALCRRIAAEGGRVVVAVDYRLAPEHPYPAGLLDALAAIRWVRDAPDRVGAAPGRLAVGGDSAGGNLTAAACIALRDAGEPLPALQVLIYPGLDQTNASASHRTFARGFLLTAADIDWFERHYAAPPTDPLASPLLVPDVAGLPPAVVTTAGFDPLRDEGEAYAERLRQAGIPVVHLDERDLVHGYANMDGVIPAADRAVARLTGAIRIASRE